MPRPLNSIFIVDDDSDDRQIILDAFLENNIAIDYIPVQSGNELLEILERPGLVLPSLILLDLNMPGLPGLQVLKKLKENKKTSPVPVIIFTTSILPSDKMLSYEMGANCFIAKPESFTELIQITHSILLVWFRELMITAHAMEAASSLE